MEQSKRGGKREGAGRKPTGRTKKPYTFYIAPNKTLKFGGDEKFKKYVYDIVENYGETNVSDIQKVFDSPPIKNYFQDEPKQWQEPKFKIKRTFENFVTLKRECLVDEDWFKLKEEIENSDLSRKQKDLLLTQNL